MVIKKIILKSFGKFQNKEIELEQNVNLIIGENEAGKTTIHKFIEGMLYGFYKTDAKKRIVTEENEKYKPWGNSNEYYGALVIEDNNEEIRIERNFTKGEDVFKIYNNITGEDISSEYEYNNVTRLYDFAKKHVSLNKEVFQNTLSIGQLKVKTTKELVNEIKNSIVNMEDSKDEKISVKKALKKIEEKKDSIGTKDRKASKYGKCLIKLDSLLEEKKETLDKLETAKTLKIEETELNRRLENLIKNKREIEKKLEVLKLKEFSEKLKEIEKIKKEIFDIEQRMKSIKIYKNINREELEKVLENKHKIELLNQEGKNIETKIAEIKKELKELESEIDNTLIEDQISSNYTNIEEDITRYEKNGNLKEELNNQVGKKQNEVVNIKKTIVNIKIGLLLAIVIMIALIAVNQTKNIEYIVYAIGGMGIISFGFLYQHINKSNSYKEIDISIKNYRIRIESIDKENGEIIERYY